MAKRNVLKIAINTGGSKQSSYPTTIVSNNGKF